MSRFIVLLSCSNRKNKGGEGKYHYSDSILSVLSNNTRDLTYGQRQQIFDLINEGKIVDKLRGDGNRKDHSYNQSLKQGPDFSQDSSEDDLSDNVYLPAYKRYDGRFFTAVGINLFEEGLFSKEYHTLITSGLYGLIPLIEPIQAYSCHLDDEIMFDVDSSLSTDEGNFINRISDLWGSSGLIERIFIEYIENHNQNNDHKIEWIIDLLSEYSYQCVFNWTVLSKYFKKKSIKCFHRVVRKVKEPEFLTDLGRFYKNEIVDGENIYFPSLKIIQRDYLETINRNKGSLHFSSKVEPNRYVEESIRQKIGDLIWIKLSEKCRENLIQGEVYFQLYNSRSLKQPHEHATRIVHYFSAVEIE